MFPNVDSLSPNLAAKAAGRPYTLSAQIAVGRVTAQGGTSMINPVSYQQQVDALPQLQPSSEECVVLAERLGETLERLQSATGRERQRDMAQARALLAQMKALHCPTHPK
jgi:hypothetical protein